MPENDPIPLAINRCLHRLPLILDILDELEGGHDHPGDRDLRDGSHRALSHMVDLLRGIVSRHSGGGTPHRSDALEIAGTWLLGDRPRKLLPPALYAELTRLTEKLIPERPGAMSDPTDWGERS